MRIKRSIGLIFIVLIFVGCNSQTKKSVPGVKYHDYYISIQCGSIKMKLDSITPLNELIPQLRTNHKLYETFKGYWIGYNDLMFSIAVHGDSAIDPLLTFIDTTNTIEAKYAGILTLNLIGINCKIVGRMYEEFTNIKARNALFELLYKYDSLQPVVMSMIIRDPREYDLPRLFYIMNFSSKDCWAITSGLLRYDLKDIPVDQPIPESILNKRIPVHIQNDSTDNELYTHIFKVIAKKYADFIIVDDSLFNYQFQCNRFYTNFDNTITINNLIQTCSDVNYMELGANFQYYYEDGKIHFCSAMTCKKLWLNWWLNQSGPYKDFLMNSNKQIGKEKW